MNLLAISGSLRDDSYNTRLLKAVGDYTEPSISVELADLANIPLYNGDLDGKTKPTSVQSFLDKIDRADGMLIATPEYNYSVSGALKNAIDWASRPAFNSVMRDKPTGILSASMSKLGGVRAQVHLRDILAATLTPVYLAPDFALASAHTAFDKSGHLVDVEAQSALRKYMTGFIDWLSIQQG